MNVDYSGNNLEDILRAVAVYTAVMMTYTAVMMTYTIGDNCTPIVRKFLDDDILAACEFMGNHRMNIWTAWVWLRTQIYLIIVYHCMGICRINTHRLRT
jgi:hypothetical protein